MIDLDIKFDFSEMEKSLTKLDQKIAITALRKAGKEAMKPVLSDMRQNVNIDKGILLNSLKMRTSRAKGRSRGSKNRVMAIRAGVFTRKSTEERRRNQAALSQEFGNSRQKAEPFIRPALKRNAQRVIDTLGGELGREIEKHKP